MSIHQKWHKDVTHFFYDFKDDDDGWEEDDDDDDFDDDDDLEAV